MQQKEKVRVYALARELNVETKDLLDLCKQAGFDVKNQLSGLDPEQAVQLTELVKRGSQKPTVGHAPAKAPASAPLPDVNRSIPNLAPARPRREMDAPRQAQQVPAPIEPPTPAPAAPAEPPVAPAAQAPPSPPPAAPAPTPAAPPAPPVEKPQAVPGELAAGQKPVEVKPADAKPAEVKKPEARPTPPMPSTPPAPLAPPQPPPSAPARVPTLPSMTGAKNPPNLPGGARSPRPPMRREMHTGLAPRAVPPPILKPMKAPPKKEENVLKPIARLTPDQIKEGKPLRPEDLIRPPQTTPVVADEEDDEEKKKKLKGVAGREGRKEARNRRAAERKTQEVPKLGTDDDGPVKTLHKVRAKAKHRPATLPRKGNVILESPITVRSLSEALGVRSVELLFKLRDHGAAANVTINSAIDDTLAEVMALEYGAALEIKKLLTAEEEILVGLDQPDKPEDLVPRAPVVTIMGHVDHGKTTLLDKIRQSDMKIRQSDIVSTEAGGITQVIRAWRVEHGGRPVTFLDTPGHEAFTKMRARGAQVTDIAVIVVAADDGVMPQTKEAIGHAKAAGVALAVAINKVDLPSANVNRTRQQLYSEGVLPDNMGGDAPFVECSAATGKGIDELLDQLSVVAELKELKANPNKPGRGTCLEAMLSEGEGVRATLLVRDGTLRRGDIILCGGTYGRVRQMYDDLGRPLEEAGPSVPVRITGLDEVPNPDEGFQVVPDLSLAREVADARKSKMQEASLHKRAPLSLEKLTEAKITELKIILKADFRGSIEAIRKELEKLHHEEVRVRLLEVGIGRITETDVWLALASPNDTMIIGFNAVPDDTARALAEEKGVQIREYNIIYNLTNDIRAALEGKLKPKEEIVQLGRAIVRNTFKISRVGTIAGCYVTQGTIRRNAKVRLIREGVVVYPPADRTVGLESLKRFKEDAAEVREGFECGLKIAGYDDLKVGDVVEAYRVDQVQRTL